MTKFRQFLLVGPRWNLQYLNTDCHTLLNLRTCAPVMRSAALVFCQCLTFKTKWSNRSSHPSLYYKLANSRRFFTFLRIFDHFMVLFGAGRGFTRILSHRAPSSLNMSFYRAIRTHFRPNFIFFGRKDLRSWSKIRDFPKMQISSSSHSHKYLIYMGL